MATTKIRDWSITTSRSRLTKRWTARLSYVGHPKGAQHVATVRRHDTEREAIADALDIARESDRRALGCGTVTR